jgi:hypothetical protein
VSTNFSISLLSLFFSAGGLLITFGSDVALSGAHFGFILFTSHGNLASAVRFQFLLYTISIDLLAGRESREATSDVAKCWTVITYNFLFGI